MCLICGFIGCLSTKNVPVEVENGANDITVTRIEVEQTGHSVDHYEQGRHVYAQNLESQEVWDFSKVSDRSIRLAQRPTSVCIERQRVPAAPELN